MLIGIPTLALKKSKPSSNLCACVYSCMQGCVREIENLYGRYTTAVLIVGGIFVGLEVSFSSAVLHCQMPVGVSAMHCIRRTTVAVSSHHRMAL